MIQVKIIKWRDIPAQINAKQGRKRDKLLLADRFQEAIDMAAMKGGAAGTDAYLNDWCDETRELEGDDIAAALASVKSQIECEFTQEVLQAYIQNSGHKPSV